MSLKDLKLGKAVSPAKEPSWEDAIVTVLEAAEGTMHYSDIAERLSSQHLKSKVGANPAATVAATLSKLLEKDDSLIQKTGRGQFALKSSLIPSDA